MTLTGLVITIFAILIVVIIFVFPLAHSILEDLLWYKNSTKIWQHVYQYIFSFALFALFIAFLISVHFLAKWGDTIILW